MKLLLYCTKAKPYLVQGLAKPMHTLDANNPYNFNWKLVDKGFSNDRLNGKIVAECDFEVEEIQNKLTNNNSHLELFTNNLIEKELFEKSCLNRYEMFSYLKNNFTKKDEIKGYAIYLKNLHIFDKPRDIRDYYTNRIYTKIEDVYTDEIQIKGSEWVRPIKQAPQNMMYAYDVKSFNNFEKKVLISIRPEWLCKILNGEKKIEVRKKVLKEMLDNE